MWELWGMSEEIGQEYIGGDFKTYYSHELVARFSTLEKAQEYVEGARLSKRKKAGSFGVDRVFKKNSLLWFYQDYEIKEYKDVPLDPDI
jgi:hypothetical protein